MATEKQLEAINRKRKEKLSREHKIVNGIDHKICNKHHIFFPSESPWIPATTEYFYHNAKNKTDYLHPECKKCSSKKSYVNILENYDRFKEGLKTYRQSEKGRKQEKRKNDRLKETRKQWWQANPNKLKEYNKNHRQHDILESEWKANQEYFNYECAYCGLPLEEHAIYRNGKLILMSFHKEHVDHNGYNDIRNCVPACKSCNSGKKEKTLDEFFERGFINGFTQEKYDKIIQWITKDYKQHIIDKSPYRAIKERNEHNNKFHWNLWSIDELRNTIRILATENKRKDLDIHIKRLFPESI